MNKFYEQIIPTPQEVLNTEKQKENTEKLLTSFMKRVWEKVSQLVADHNWYVETIIPISEEEYDIYYKSPKRTSEILEWQWWHVNIESYINQWKRPNDRALKITNRKST